MKKIIFIASVALCSMLVKAQTVQTKTEKINDETTRTYSFYKNETGEEVRHGKYTITWKVNKNEYKVNNRLDCTYKDGLLHGKLTYSCDWNVYKAYLSLLGKEDVVWKLEQKNLDNFSVDMYQGYMTGDINVTYQGWWTNETTFKAKAINGVLADESELIITERPRQLVKEKLIYLNDGKEAKRYKNVLPANTPNANLQEPSEFIAFEFPSDQYGGMEKYFIYLPRYVDKPFDELTDIPDYNFLISYKGTKMSDIAYIEDKIRNNYYLSQASKDTLNARYNLAKQQVKDRQEAERNAAVQRKNTYYAAYKKAINTANQLRNVGYPNALPYFYQSDGNIYPVVTDKNVENILFAAFSKRRADIQEVLNSLDLSNYDENSKIKVKGQYGTFNSKNTYEELTDDIVKTMTDYVNRLNNEDIPNSIEKLAMIRDMENTVMDKIFSISKSYTKSTFTGGRVQAGARFPRFNDENCTTKCTMKKDLYNAYVEVAAYLYQRLMNCSIDEHLEIITQFINVAEVMEFNKNAKTKDVEKALKAATTPEEKLNIFLKQ